jgi:hypothetical protein
MQKKAQNLYINAINNLRENALNVGYLPLPPGMYVPRNVLASGAALDPFTIWLQNFEILTPK